MEKEVNYMNVKTVVINNFIDKVTKELDTNFDENLLKVIDSLRKHDKKKGIEKQLNYIEKLCQDKENVWYKYIKNIWINIDKDVRNHLVKSFIIYGNVIANPKQRQAREKYNCNIPWAILMDSTSSCNLHCIGCWAANYDKKLNMSLDTLSSIIEQGEKLGTYFYIYSGGEPLVRKKDIITLCKKYPECTFLSFTNGTLIDEEFCKQMLEVHNFIPAISVEGFEEETDQRRGKGTYQKVLNAMKLLKENHLPFGISCCYTSQNYLSIGSEEYFDFMINHGALFAWLFTYMPIGKGAKVDLMATNEQREYMYHQVRKFRKTKPIFTMDFWNDGEYVGGCIAGGRRYLHINANGDVEPCAFIHYSNYNIHDHTLLECLQSPLFMAYKENQPFNKNMLRPCPVLDNPGRLTIMVDDSKAKSTDMLFPEEAKDYCDKCVDASVKWAKTADKLWKEHQK